MKEVLFGGAAVSSIFANITLTILRVGVGLTLAFAHGIKKMPPPEQFVGFVQSIGFPMPALFAWAAALSEFIGGILLAIGLLTRPAAAFIVFTMLVAVFGAHGADPFEKKELALLFAFGASAFIGVGSGRYGLDAVIQKRK